jgi:serine/threonine protein kinase
MGTIPERLNAALTGRYRIEEKLGAGGMATVYRALDIRYSRLAAVRWRAAAHLRPRSHGSWLDRGRDGPATGLRDIALAERNPRVGTGPERRAARPAAREPADCQVSNERWSGRGAALAPTRPD